MSPSTMYLTTFIPALLATFAFAIPTHNSLHIRDEASAVALVSGYTSDNCDGSPFGDFVLDFEPSGDGRCIGNGTVTKGVNVQKLAPGCVGECSKMLSGDLCHAD